VNRKGETSNIQGDRKSFPTGETAGTSTGGGTEWPSPPKAVRGRKRKQEVDGQKKWIMDAR